MIKNSLLSNAGNKAFKFYNDNSSEKVSKQDFFNITLLHILTELADSIYEYYSLIRFCQDEVTLLKNKNQKMLYLKSKDNRDKILLLAIDMKNETIKFINLINSIYVKSAKLYSENHFNIDIPILNEKEWRRLASFHRSEEITRIEYQKDVLDDCGITLESFKKKSKTKKLEFSLFHMNRKRHWDDTVGEIFLYINIVKMKCDYISFTGINHEKVYTILRKLEDKAQRISNLITVYFEKYDQFEAIPVKTEDFLENFINEFVCFEDIELPDIFKTNGAYVKINTN